MTVCEWWWDGYVASTDPEKLERATTRRCLSTTRRCEGFDDVRETGGPDGDRVVLGVYDGGKQVGLVRASVSARGHGVHVRIWVPDDRRAAGLCRWLAEVVRSHPDLGGMRLEFSVFDVPRGATLVCCRSPVGRR